MGFLTMRHTTYPYNISSTRKAARRCGFLDYCHLEKRSDWTLPATFPNPTSPSPSPSPSNNNNNNNRSATQGQGPTEFGLHHHFCSDLAGFSNTLFQTDENEKNFMEFLVVEYASDVEQQTPHTNTTQETVSLYLAAQLKMQNLTRDDSVCVVNTGVHDQKLCHQGRTSDADADNECLELYVNNVKSYMKQLDPVCGNIVWLGITSVRGDSDQPQRNEVSLQWNRAVNASLARWYPTKSFFVDVWNVSSHATHRPNDNIHFEPEYYVPLGTLFSSLM